MRNKQNNTIVAYAIALADTYNQELPYLCYTRERGWYSSYLPDGLISAPASRENGRAVLQISDWGYLTNLLTLQGV